MNFIQKKFTQKLSLLGLNLTRLSLRQTLLVFCFLCSFFILNLTQAKIVTSLENLQKNDYYLPGLNYDLRVSSQGELFVEFKDGRRAKLIQDNYQPETLQASFTLSEISCDKFYTALPTPCNLNYTYKKLKFYFKWISHPDAKKIGHHVQVFNQLAPVDSADPSYTDLLFTTSATWETAIHWNDSKFKTETLLQLSQPIFTCDQKPQLSWYDLLTNKSTLDQMEWSQELMQPNTETKANENRAVQSTQGIQIQKLPSAHTYSIGFASNAKNQFNPIFPLIIGDVLGWSVKTPKQGQCELTVKSNASSLFINAQSRESKMIGKSSLQLPSLYALEEILRFSAETNLQVSIHKIKLPENLYILSFLGLITIQQDVVEKQGTPYYKLTSKELK